MDFSISNELILWYMTNKRALPWRNTSSPYEIWVSEIILQQTRVAQGLSYYERFIDTFPDIESLAQAREEKVLKMWQGLGYYSRARNMHSAAKQIVNSYQGKFPDKFKLLLSLKGVGEYTAAAVASLAFNEPVAVVDGNVIRVISRLFAIREPVDRISIMKEIKKLASELLPPNKPAIHNQAIMEFGALQCIPSNPDCTQCPLNFKCLAYKYKIVRQIPFKSQKNQIRNRYFYYLVISQEQGFFFEKRKAGDIWEGLYEFPLIEKSEPLDAEELEKEIINLPHFKYNQLRILKIQEPVKHILSHQKLFVSFIYLKAEKILTHIPASWIWIKAEEIYELAVPRAIDRYIHSQVFNKINENI